MRSLLARVRVIVHDGVHILDPDGVDGAVEDQPREVLLVLIRLTPERGEDPLGPFVGDHVEEAEHLGRVGRLRVLLHLVVRLADQGWLSLRDQRVSFGRPPCLHELLAHREEPGLVRRVVFLLHLLLLQRELRLQRALLLLHVVA
jgi:hypothetical protein